MATQKTGDYNKEMQKSLQNQYNRVQKQQASNVETLSPKELAAKAPDVPADSVEVICQFCGQKILAEEPGVDAHIKLNERKFRTCRHCRDQIVGYGGYLDRNTHGLARDRKL